MAIILHYYLSAICLLCSIHRSISFSLSQKYSTVSGLRTAPSINLGRRSSVARFISSKKYTIPSISNPKSLEEERESPSIDTDEGGELFHAIDAVKIDKGSVSSRHIDNLEEQLWLQYLAYEALLKKSNSTEPMIDIFEAPPSSPEPLNYDAATTTTSLDHHVGTKVMNNAGFSFPQISEIWKARGLLLLAAALYGTNFTFVKILNDHIPVDIGTTLRFGLAAGATLPFLFKSTRTKLNQSETKIQVESGQDSSFEKTDTTANLGTFSQEKFGMDPVFLAGCEIGLWNALGYLAQSKGLETVDASKSAFICSMAVIVVPILDFMSGKKLASRELIGAIMAMIGVAFLEVGELNPSQLANSVDAFSLSVGDLLTLVQPFAFGLGFWRMEHAMRKYPDEAMKLTSSQLLAIFIGSLGYCIASSAGDPALFSQILTWLQDPLVIGTLCWTGLITTAFTVYLETLALKTLSAAETTVLFSTEPLFGSMVAAVVLNESLGQGGTVGGILILAGCIISSLRMKNIMEN